MFLLGNFDENEKLKEGGVDLLSPSEVVKMRKKSRTIAQDPSPEAPKERDGKSSRNKMQRTAEKPGNRDKSKEQDKKKDSNGRNKRDKTNKGDANKKYKNVKEKKRNVKKVESLFPLLLLLIFHFIIPCE